MFPLSLHEFSAYNARVIYACAQSTWWYTGITSGAKESKIVWENLKSLFSIWSEKNEVVKINIRFENNVVGSEGIEK